MLNLINLTKEFNNIKILDSVNFTFKKGFYILKGKSGIGKTTLLNIVAGYLYPDKGEIKQNENLKIEYLFQEDLLFSNLTVEENMFIKYNANEYINKYNSIDIFKGILSKLKIEHLINKKISTLSGGEKQRVQLANILIREPDVILMDEPISKLDKENRECVIDLILNIFKEKIVIIVSHDEIIGDFNYLKIENGVLVNEER